LISPAQDPLTPTVAPATTPHKSAVSNRPAPRWHAGDAPQASFARLATTLPGRVGLAVAPLGDGPVVSFGALQAGHAWSTMKVPVLTTLLADLEARDAQLDPASRQDAELALEQSDNAAAEALFSELESSHGGLVGASAAVTRTLARAGDRQVAVNTTRNADGFTTWGQTEWPAAGEVTFYRALARGCLLSGPDTAWVLGLMAGVTASQRWGAGATGFGAPVAFKGGWGPDGDLSGGYLVRQTAIVGSRSDGYVFSMLAAPTDGSFATGTVMLTGIAGWVARTFGSSVPAPAASC
jgi:hypothetical protein